MYFVVGYRKLKADGITKAIEHNLRRMEKILKHINNKKNIILEMMDFKNDKEHVQYCNSRLAKGKRKTKEDVAHGFEIIIDCSKDRFKNESEHLQYLKEAHEFIKDRFKGQLILNSVIHMDEGKPHLHMLISFYNEDKQKWNQKELMKEGKTDLNQLLNDFENQIGKKYGLKRGDYQSDEAVKRETKKLLNETLEIEKKLLSDDVIKVKDKKKLLNEIKKMKQAEHNLRRLNEKMKAKEKQKLRSVVNKDKVRQLHPSNIILDEKLEDKTKINYLINNPLREDKHPSMSVFQDSSGIWLYHDFATGETFDNIDIYMKLNNCSYWDAVNELSANNDIKKIYDEKPKINEIIKKVDNKENEKIKKPDITTSKYLNINLYDYIKERLNLSEFKQPPGIINIFEKIKDKTYYYIGLKNRSGGYACRNKFIKKNAGTNNYTEIDNKQARTIITEGMMDYISLYQKYENTVNYVILNSINNIKKVINDDILKYKQILIYTDNDDAGNKAAMEIKNNYINVVDKRWTFGEYKDYNEYYKNDGYKEEEEKLNKKYEKEAERLLNNNDEIENKENRKDNSPTIRM